MLQIKLCNYGNIHSVQLWQAISIHIKKIQLLECKKMKCCHMTKNNHLMSHDCNCDIDS